MLPGRELLEWQVWEGVRPQEEGGTSLLIPLLCLQRFLSRCLLTPPVFLPLLRTQWSVLTKNCEIKNFLFPQSCQFISWVRGWRRIAFINHDVHFQLTNIRQQKKPKNSKNKLWSNHFCFFEQNSIEPNRTNHEPRLNVQCTLQWEDSECLSDIAVSHPS